MTEDSRELQAFISTLRLVGWTRAELFGAGPTSSGIEGKILFNGYRDCANFMNFLVWCHFISALIYNVRNEVGRGESSVESSFTTRMTES